MGCTNALLSKGGLERPGDAKRLQARGRRQGRGKGRRRRKDERRVWKKIWESGLKGGVTEEKGGI